MENTCEFLWKTLFLDNEHLLGIEKGCQIINVIFFLGTDGNEVSLLEQSTKRRPQHETLDKPGLTHHLVHRRDVPETWHRTAVQQRSSERADRRTSKGAQACWTLPCSTKGEARALAFAKLTKKLAVSMLHLPPTSAANTTRRALPPSPDNSR